MVLCFFVRFWIYYDLTPCSLRSSEKPLLCGSSLVTKVCSRITKIDTNETTIHPVLQIFWMAGDTAGTIPWKCFDPCQFAWFVEKIVLFRETHWVSSLFGEIQSSLSLCGGNSQSPPIGMEYHLSGSHLAIRSRFNHGAPSIYIMYEFLHPTEVGAPSRDGWSSSFSSLAKYLTMLSRFLSKIMIFFCQSRSSAASPSRVSMRR